METAQEHHIPPAFQALWLYCRFRGSSTHATCVGLWEEEGMCVLLLHNWFIRQIKGEEEKQVNALSLWSKMDWQLQHSPVLDV